MSVIYYELYANSTGGFSPDTPTSFYDWNAYQQMPFGWNTGQNRTEHAAIRCPIVEYIPSNTTIFGANLITRQPTGNQGYGILRRSDNNPTESNITWNNFETGGHSTTQLHGSVWFPAYSYTAVDVRTSIDWMVNNQGANRYFLLYKYSTSYYPIVGTRNNSSNFPYVQVGWGYNLTGLSVWGGYRGLNASWNAAGYADSYNVHVDGVFYTNTTNTSVAIYPNPGIKSGSHTVTVYPYYNTNVFTGGNAGSQAGSPTSSLRTPAAPSATGDNPLRKKAALSTSAIGSVDNNTHYQFLVYDNSGAAGSAKADSGLITSNTYTADLMSQAAGTYYAFVKAYWSSSWNSGGTDLSPISSGTSFTITQPTVNNIAATSNLNRQIEVTWSTTGTTDAATYDVKITARDGTNDLTVNVPNTDGASGGGANYTYAHGTGTRKVTFLNVYSGQPGETGGNFAHTLTVTPVITGYTGSTTPGITTGYASKPTPTITSATGDSPAKRQIRVVAPSAASSYYTASSWDIRRDNNDSTIVNSTSATIDMSTVNTGTHPVQLRARWADGDIGPWSNPVDATTTSPPVTGVAARQTNAPAVVTRSLQTGGSLTVGTTYYTAVSVNKGGSRIDGGSIGGDTHRYYNESTPSQMPDANGLAPTSGNQTIRVSKPANCTGSDTWNVYCGTNKNLMKLMTSNVASGTATYDITSWSAPASNEARHGKVDLTWTAPAGVGDGPSSYRIERSPSYPANVSNGSPTTWTDVTSTSVSGIYSTTNFYQNGLDTKFWFFRIYAVYSNDLSPSVDVVVSA